jgi:hypothetical protein
LLNRQAQDSQVLVLFRFPSNPVSKKKPGWKRAFTPAFSLKPGFWALGTIDICTTCSCPGQKKRVSRKNRVGSAHSESSPSKPGFACFSLASQAQAYSIVGFRLSDMQDEHQM